MFGFDSKDFFGFPSCFVFCLKWKNKSNCFLFFVWILSIKISTNKKTQGTFGFWDFSMQKTKPKCWKTNGFLTYWLIISIQKTKNTCFLFFHFRQKTKQLGTPPKNVLSQNHTFSQKFFFCFARVLFFGFVFWFTWLPSVSVCLLTLPFLGSQTLTNVSHSRACALCETKLGIGCAKQCLCTWKLAVATLSCSISSNFCAGLGILESHIHIPV